MAPGSIKDRPNSQRDAAYHFTLLAQDETGYRNLVKLMSTAHLEGMHYKPRIDKELLAAHSEGLIGMSACLKGEINMAIQADQSGQSARRARRLFAIFSGRRISFSSCTITASRRSENATASCRRSRKEFGLGLVAANDVHFLERSHHEAHDVMICIGTGKMVHDEKRMRYVPELYFKSADEMRALFPDHPEAISNTVAIAERCNLEAGIRNLEISRIRPRRRARRAKQYLRELCDRGFAQALRRTRDDRSGAARAASTRNSMFSRRPGSSVTS